MRHALALSSVVLTTLALTGACAETPNRGMQPDPGTGYTVQTTGAEIVGRDDPNATGGIEQSEDVISMRLAAEICDREVRCHSGEGTPTTRSADDCWHASLARTRRELGLWRCSPAGARARAKDCVASLRNEPCEHDLERTRSLCTSNVACGADSTLPAPRPVVPAML